MTQTEIQFRAAEATLAQRGGQTQNSRLQAIFQARPNQWIPMPELADAIHAYAVHSRVADLRSEKYGFMNIEQRSHKRAGITHSFYRYLPDPSAP